MTILGVDPGTATTGYGIIEKIQSTKHKIQNSGLRCISYGCITTPKEKKPGDRLVSLEKELLAVLDEYKPDAVVIERLYFFKNLKSAMPVSEARGVILLAIAKKKIPVFELTPLQAKMAITGYGRADKKQMQRMVQQTLGLSDMPKPDDAADALGLAIAGVLLTRTTQK
ncbi:MAG: crossover junction endodeoxyribonuclease RuvC [Candidatus Wildermuthbacteria bacterium]|nr:crossover junction endodeoxyribonuclease RuvC [Candidatus Wildermuthbacteria bacterium]